MPTSPAPPALVDALHGALADPGFRRVTVGVSMWVEGYGEVLAEGADRPLSPGSVQKVFTAMGALSLFEPDDAFLRNQFHQVSKPAIDLLARNLLHVRGHLQ